MNERKHDKFRTLCTRLTHRLPRKAKKLYAKFKKDDKYVCGCGTVAQFLKLSNFLSYVRYVYFSNLIRLVITVISGANIFGTKCALDTFEKQFAIYQGFLIRILCTEKHKTDAVGRLFILTHVD